MIFRELSNAVFRFVLQCAGAEIDGGCSNTPPPQKKPKNDRNDFEMIFRELSNAVLRFVLQCAGAEIDGGVQTPPPPPPAGGGKSRGPAGRGLIFASSTSGDGTDSSHGGIWDGATVAMLRRRTPASCNNSCTLTQNGTARRGLPFWNTAKRRGEKMLLYVG